MRNSNLSNTFRKIFRYKWFWRTCLALLILFGAVAVIKIFFLESWLQKKVVNLVQEKSKGLYTLHIGHLDASVLGGSITLDNLHLSPDFDLWQKRKEKKTPDLPAYLIKLKSSQLRISGLNYLHLLAGRPIKLNHISLKAPEIIHTQMARDSTEDGRVLYQKLSGPFKGFRVNGIQVTNGTFINRKFGEKGDKLKMMGVDLEIKDLQLDSASFNHPKRFFYAQDVQFTAASTKFLIPGGDYRLQTGAITFATRKAEVTLDSIKIIPLYQPWAMARRKGQAVTTVKVSVPAARLAQVNFPAFSRDSYIDIGQIILESPSIDAYSDYKNFKAKGNQPLLHDMVQQVKTGITLKHSYVKNMYVKYKELDTKSAKPGLITLEKAFITCTNISNDKNRISNKNPAIIKGQGLVMGKASMRVNIRVNLLDKNGYHTVQGWIGKGDPQILNPILEPTVLLSVKSGFLQKGSFQMQVFRNSATGTMQLYYQDFKVDLLSKSESTDQEPATADKGDNKKQSFGKKVLSAIANKVLIKSDNKPEKEIVKEPAPENGLRVGKIKVTRRKERSIVTYWIDGLASGVLSSIGMSSKLPQKK